MKIRSVFTDLDGTLTDNEKISSETYSALHRLRSRGLWIVVVSGRPAGWADCLMRLWPIDGMIFENGAGLVCREGKKLRLINLTSRDDIPSQQKKLEEIFQGLKRHVPHLKLASDQRFRIFDYAIDFAEEPPYLSDSELDLVLKTLNEKSGITAKLSSIHVNFWVGSHTKVTACTQLLSSEGKTREISKEQVVFCGDSPNDESLFQFFDHTVGVANIKKFLPQMKYPPKYITQNSGGLGFQEMVNFLLQ